MAELTWRQPAGTQLPEEKYPGKHREQAVSEILEDAGIATEEFEYGHPRRELSEPVDAAVEICRLGIENPDTVLLVYWFLEEKFGGEVEIDDEDVDDQVQERINELRETGELEDIIQE